jgi:hypothetical protein
MNFNTLLQKKILYMSRRILLLLLLFLGCCYSISAQEKIVKKDSTTVYKNIENYSKKRKFTKFVHKLLFRSTKKSAPSKKSIRNKYIIKRAFDKNEGKIIRKINVVTLDPFGYSVTNKVFTSNRKNGRLKTCY